MIEQILNAIVDLSKGVDDVREVTYITKKFFTSEKYQIINYKEDVNLKQTMTRGCATWGNIKP